MDLDRICRRNVSSTRCAFFLETFFISSLSFPARIVDTGLMYIGGNSGVGKGAFDVGGVRRRKGAM